MQTINFQSLGFEGIPQHEMQARQRYYDAVTKPWSEFGNIVSNTAGKVGDAMYRRAQDDKAEEWRRRQWENQLDQQRFSREQTKLQNRRYDEELRRKLAEEQADRDATEALRKDFLRQYGYGYNLDRYGLPGQFAMSRIRNARNWQDMVGAGQALTQAIQYQDMLRGQQEEQQRERFIPNFIKDYDTRMAYEERFNFDKPEQAAYGYTTEELGTRYSNLMGEKEDLEALIASDPRYKSPEVVRRLNALNDAISIMGDRILRIRHPERYNKHSRFSRD